MYYPLVCPPLSISFVLNSVKLAQELDFSAVIKYSFLSLSNLLLGETILDNLAKRDPIAHYSKMIKANQLDYRALNNRGNEYEKRGHHDLAIDDYNRCIELRPDFALAYINRGNTYQKIGNYNRALEDYNKAIELNPNKDMAYNNRGFHYMLMGHFEQAEKDIRKALEISPNNIYALNSMAELFAARNDAEEACRWLKKAIDRGYNNWNYIRISKTYENIRTSRCYQEIMAGNV